MREIVEAVEGALPGGAWPVWTGSNHDAGRLATRWAKGDPDRARAALVMLLTLRGTPFLYYGDELGLTDGSVTDLRDKAGGRDGGRTPMPWGGDSWGDSAWLPLHAPTDVARQREDPGSTVHLVRALIDARRAFVREPYETLPAPDGVWAYQRGNHVIVLNLTADPLTVEHAGDLRLGTRPRDGFDGRLEPYEAVVLT